MANVKVGNFVRPADVGAARDHHPDRAGLRHASRCRRATCPTCAQAIAAETATVEAVIPGETRRATGQVTMIENTVDAATGMVTVRATMPNADELLWPGTLVQRAR